MIFSLTIQHLPHMLSATVVLGLLSAAKAASKSTSSSSGGVSFILILLAFFALLWFMFVRPQRQRARAQQDVRTRLEVGQEVLTQGGVVGVVDNIDGERVTLDIGEGNHIVVLRQFILHRMDQVPGGTGAVRASAGTGVNNPHVTIDPASGPLHDEDDYEDEDEEDYEDEDYDDEDEEDYDDESYSVPREDGAATGASLQETASSNGGLTEGGHAEDDESTSSMKRENKGNK